MYAGELLSKLEGGCQSFGCLLRFAVTNHCNLGQPSVRKKLKKKKRKMNVLVMYLNTTHISHSLIAVYKSSLG